MKRLGYIRSVSEDQRGLVSIIVTMLIMLIISLVVVGFATLVRRDQRQVLDRQLSTQAFYAAEFGVNVAIQKLTTGSSIPPNGLNADCDDFLTAPADRQVGNNADLAQVSCLLVGNAGETLEFDAVDMDSEIVSVRVGAGVIDTINISWRATDTTVNYDTNCNGFDGIFPPAWPCGHGVLRVDIVNIPPAPFARSALNNNTRTVFLYPQEGAGGSWNWSNVNDKIVLSGCTGSTTPPEKECKASITGLNGGHYYLRMQSLYATSSVSINARRAGGSVALVGGQVVIDSTGKAGDVLRRIQVRYNVTPQISNVDANFPLQVLGSLCKRFKVGSAGIDPDNDGLPTPTPAECNPLSL